MRTVILSCFLATVTAFPAAAANCRNVEVWFQNRTASEIEITQIRAYNRDDNRWRTIRSNNFEVPPHNSSTFMRIIENIPGSRDEDVALRVRYRLNGVNPRYVIDTSYTTCENDGGYIVTIRGPNHRLDR